MRKSQSLKWFALISILSVWAMILITHNTWIDKKRLLLELSAGDSKKIEQIHGVVCGK